MLRLSLIVLLAAGCAGTDTAIAEAETCEDCLDVGGSWRLEAELCAVECESSDGDCFVDECPPVCGEECGGCFSQDECLGSGCVWIGSGDDFFCTG
jgi:hypothetical protein